ncbi:SDR family oxidoreductase [Parasphingopyxis algicola]|uniref:SDR family NAD(P)-dependent oxidoreductase n=1 Tax=Parasphingopyxis algicola TaxID=2026624 RepID=UPI0015A48CB4|nr:SDR family NAD(P)-dependent oxidoreductase [Parasphingopyxis algicola]QLC25405.1 SDR family oxidoreductase [Parasphingopyxis algicola]
MSRTLEGRKAIVTGAASGIGAATAKRLASEGAKVLAVDLAANGLDALGDDIATLIADLGDPDSIDAIVSEAEGKLGGLDILVNNAGVLPAGAIDELTDEIWEFGIAINMLAPFRLSRACLPMLRQSDAARIVNVGSILSRYGDPGLTAYTATKHGILGITRAMAAELGPEGIVVNCVQPGAIMTGMTRDTFETSPEAVDHYTTKCVLGRIGEPEDIGDVIAFLSSDDARFITGQGIIVDGGLTLRS